MERHSRDASPYPLHGVTGAALLLGILLAGAAPLIPLAILVARYEAELLPLFAVPLAVLVAAWRIARDRARDQLTDPLTGLANRQALLLAARAAIAEGSSVPPPAPVGRVGLILLDLDRFRSLNDTLGHAAGDRLLVQISHRLHAALSSGELLPGAVPGGRRGSDPFSVLPPAVQGGRRVVVARMGGDEFAVLLPGVGCSVTLQRLARALIAELAAPSSLDGLLLVLEASAGVCIFPDHAGDAETLLRRADVAMGHAQRGRTGVEVYDQERDADTPIRVGLLGDLRRALEAGEVELHYQPKVAFDGRVVGLEALLRWDRPGRGRISPEEFVGLAESSGLMPRLTDYVLDAAVRQLAEWRSQGLEVQVAVNVSPRDVLTPGFAAGVADRLARHAVPPQALQLEITERLLLDDSRRAADTLDELRRHGVGMSLDDFGTGHSSLVRLRSLPVGELKIDRSFVSRMVADDHDAAVVRCSVELAHSLGLTVVAEGVEDDETWEQLHSLGVDAVQGWLVSAALPADQASAWLRVRRAALPPAERVVRPALPETPAAAPGTYRAPPSHPSRPRTPTSPPPPHPPDHHPRARPHLPTAAVPARPRPRAPAAGSPIPTAPRTAARRPSSPHPHLPTAVSPPNRSPRPP
ncbi:putative bifunctional diguanylate cyclase/phosphodiesterase [Peterkaempfera bronchialis]|nr:bifunctional diguanylate cyclase/phosphodiesterase [Peterkaempfera bronchialis]